MSLKRLLIPIYLITMFISVPVMLATEEAEAAAVDAATVPGGVSTLMFLLGIGAIVLVGGAMLARDSFQSDNKD